MLYYFLCSRLVVQVHLRAKKSALAVTSPLGMRSDKSEQPQHDQLFSLLFLLYRLDVIE